MCKQIYKLITFSKVGTKLLSGLVIFSIFSSDFHNSIGVVPLYLMYFEIIPKEKHFAPLRILTLLIKSFDNSFFYVALTFFDNLLSSFLFKSIFFMKLAILFRLAKFACFNPAVKFSDVKFLSSNTFIKIMISSNFIFNFTNFVLWSGF